jgi:Protein of unknown function (DUF2844)
MMSINIRRCGRLSASLAALGVTLLLAATPVRAALGGTEATVRADQAQMSMTLRTLPAVRFTVHELTAASGATVREYVAPTGLVFGVAWQGSSMPDLRQVLGAYFDQYVEAAAARRTRRAPVHVELPGLVVQSGGHMRAFTGRAYLPQSLPQGVAAEEIR